jgi:hypothetical protein
MGVGYQSSIVGRRETKPFALAFNTPFGHGVSAESQVRGPRCADTFHAIQLGVGHFRGTLATLVQARLPYFKDVPYDLRRLHSLDQTTPSD